MLHYTANHSVASVSVAAHMGKASPNRSVAALLPAALRGFPSQSETVLILQGGGRCSPEKAMLQEVSYQSGAKEYCKVTLHNRPHTRDLLRKETPRGVAFAQMRSSRRLSRVCNRFLGGRCGAGRSELFRKDISRVRIGKLSIPELG